MSVPSTFSYAQAARGKPTTAQGTPPQVGSPAPPSTSSLGKDDAVSTTTTTGTALSSQPASEPVDGKTAAHEPDFSLPKQESEAASVAGSTTSAAAEGPAAASRDDEASVAGSLATAATSEKPARNANTNSRQDSGEPRKGRKGKKGKNADKDAEKELAEQKEAEKEAIKIELKEAPQPAVNPWHKRIEAHASQVNLTPGQAAKSSVAHSDPSPAAASATQNSKKQAADANEATPSAAKVQRRTGDAPRPGEQRRSGPRGSRSDKDDRTATTTSLPSVQDAAHWPTPEIAAVAEDGKPKAVAQDAERTGKDSQEDGGQAKSRQKWVTVPFVPSVAFQTQIPQRGSKPRGGARVAREAGSRGPQGTSAATASDKTTTAAAGSSATKTPEGRDAPRENSSPARASSQAPATAKRGSVDASSARDQRKSSAQSSVERAKEPASESSTAAGKAETTRESGYQNLKEQGHNRPEVRNERGGRGGYRGRGGHNGHPAPGHMSQSGFPPNGQRYTSHAVYGAQHQNPYSPPPGQYSFGGNHSSRNGRGNARSQSLSNGPSYGNRAANGNPQRNHSLQTSELPQEYQMHAFNNFAHFPATSYQDPDLVHGLKLQVEYYFSVDNLCKDTFLRRNMDSQGFVPLFTVAKFQRMAALAPSVEFIRIACAQSDKIDYVLGDDSIERLRCREKWDKFLLPIEDRDAEARTAGPAHFVYRSLHSLPQQNMPNQMLPSGYPAMSPTGYTQQYPPNGDQMYSFYANGIHAEPSVNGGAVNGFRYPADSQLSAAVPDFAPNSLSSPPPTLEIFQNWSDDQVENLMVNLSEDRRQSTKEAGNTAEPSTPKVVNGSQDASSDSAEAPATDPPRTNSVAYPTLRAKALEQRKAAAPGETPPGMRDLYAFWSDALTEHFNARMYEEFRNYALEDGRKETPRKWGINRLIAYYHSILFSNQERRWAAGKPLHDFFTPHFEEAKQVSQTIGQLVNGEGRN